MNNLLLHPLLERKQIGILYHFTKDPRMLFKILEAGYLRSDVYDYVSFTRDYNLEHEGGCIRMNFDGERLSDRYSFEPYCYGGQYYTAKNVDKYGYKPLYNGSVRKECEERINALRVPFTTELLSVDLKDLRVEYEQRIAETEGNGALASVLRTKVEQFTAALEKIQTHFPQLQVNIVTQFRPFK